MLNEVRSRTRTFRRPPFLDFPEELNFRRAIQARAPDLQLQRHLTTNYRELDKARKRRKERERGRKRDSVSSFFTAVRDV